MTHYSLVTVDVWDTILRRTCHPEAIKFQASRLLLIKYRAYLKSNLKTPNDIYIARLSVERSLGKEALKNGFDDEYDISEVINTLLKLVTTLDKSSIRVACKWLINIEVNLEVSQTFVDSKFIKTVEGICYDSIHYVSDFYMGSSLLDEILRLNGIDFVILDSVVSCDHKLNKRSSNLYQKLIDHKGYNPASWLHFGDNRHSDVSMPQKLGIEAKHYVNEAEENKKHKVASLFESKDYCINQVLRNHKDASLTDVGINLSSLFVGFSEYILEKSSLQRVDKIVFITREGKFLSRVFEKYLGSLGYSDCIDVEYDVLNISRFALLRSTKFTLRRYEKVWLQYGLRDVSKFLGEQGVVPHDIKHLCQKYQLQENEIIEKPLQDERVLDLVTDQLFISANETIADEQSALMSEYVVNVLGEVAKNILLVDVGWFGSCQDLLSEMFPQYNFSGVYLGLRQRKGSHDKNKKGYLFDEQKDKQVSPLARFGEVFEVLTASKTPSVLGFSNNHGCSTVIFDDKHQPGEFNEHINTFQQGVVEGAKMWGELIANSRLDSNDLRGLGIDGFIEVMKDPPQELAALYFESIRHDIFRESTYSRRDAFPSISSLFQATYNKYEREKVIFFFRSIQWREGAAYALRDKPAILRIVYFILFKAALFAKTVYRVK